MPTISGLGASSNAGVAALVQQQLASEREPLTRLEEQRSDLQDRISAYATLSGKLRALRNAADEFRWSGQLSAVNQFTATSSQPEVVAATAGGAALPGVYSVTVGQIARAHSLGSLELDGSQELSLAGSYRLRIEQGGASHEVAVTIAEGATLSEALSVIAGAINEAVPGLQAAPVVTHSGDGRYRLLIAARETGTANAVTAIRDLEGELAATLGLAGEAAPGGDHPATVQAAADAELSISGLSVVSGSNHIENILPGLTLDLRAPTTDAASVTVAGDAEAVTTDLQSLLASYNDLLDHVRTQTAGADENGEGRGAFTGDVLFMGLRSQLRAAATAQLSTGSLRRLTDLGISVDREGHLTLTDTSKLSERLAEDAEAVARLFNDENQGIALGLVNLTDRYVRTGGLVASHRQLEVSRQRFLDRRITQMEVYLERRAELLTDQLGEMQSMMATLQNQQAYLAQAFGSGSL
jgi:flagellar hook-associated protein 2